MTTVLQRLTDTLNPAAAAPDPPAEPAGVRRRRRVVVAATTVVGAVLTAFALNEDGTGPRFFLLTFALAATWIGGALLSGPLPVGPRNRRDLLTPVAVAAVAFAVFAVGAVIVREIPYLHEQVQQIIGHASGRAALLAALVAVVNGIGEEVFFRGAAYTALGSRNPAVTSTALYLAVIACAGVPILLVAGLIMGSLFALERRATRGVLASTLTHVVWTLLMLAFLPR